MCAGYSWNADPRHLMSSVGHRLCRTESGRPRGLTGAMYVALGIAASAGCGSAPPTEAELAYASSMGATVEMATSAAEEEALLRAAALPAGEPTQLDGAVVVAGPIYMAASGRHCRELIIGSSQRLACEAVQADGWVFVPNVFTVEPITAGDEAPTPPPTPESAETEEGTS